MNYATKTAIVVTAAILLIQFLHYGKDHNNPPINSEPAWSSPDVRKLAKRACFNCHSNETVWPFYASVAPISWLVYYDVAAAREKLNFSDWQGGNRAGEDAIAVVHEITKGEMPPFRYVIAHPDAKLSAEEKKLLSEGLQVTFSQSMK